MRVLVFGVDGLAFRIIKPMMQAGYLPHFQALAQEGVEACLESNYPPLTPPAWMSLVTGLKPAQHGVYDFWEYNEQGTGRLMTQRKGGKAIWKLLSEYGKRVIVVNVPLTYPPEPINGIMVSGIQGSSERGNCTYPTSFREELFAHVPRYRIDVDVTSVVHGSYTPAQAAVQLIEQRIALMRYLLSEKVWDFAFITFCAADYLQHLCWEDIIALQPDLMRYYQLLDEALGFARSTLGSDGSLFVVSDHGFQGAATKFAINEYLLRQRWMHPFEQGQYYRSLTHAWGKHLLDRVGLLEQGRKLKLRAVHKRGQSLTKVQPYLTRQHLQTAGMGVASWSSSSGGFADISITRSLSAQLMADLRGSLLALRDPLTGQQLIASVYGTEVFGQGPFQPSDQHLLLLPSEGYTFTPAIGQPWLWNRERHVFGTHQKDGVLYACGPTIKRGQQIAPTAIYDLVPTILRIMHLPQPDELDGQVIDDLFIDAVKNEEDHSSSTLVAQKLKQLTLRA